MLDHATHETNLQRLALLFNDIERSSWVFAIYSSTAYVQRMRAELVLRLNLQIVDYALGPTRRDPLAYLDELPPAAQTQRLVISFTGLDQALPELFGYLDYQREAYTQHPHGLLFWVTEDVWRQVMRRAPNFYSRRSGVFDFRTPGAEPAPALVQETELQAQLAQLQAEIQALELLRSRLGDALVNQQQAELTQQHALLTGSGAIAQGSGAQAASGGSVIAETIEGDVTIIRNQWQVWVSPVYSQAPVTKVPLDVLQAAYLRALADECRRLPLGILDPQWVRSAQEKQVALPDIYVDLDVVTQTLERDRDEQALALHLARGEGSNRTPLLQALAAADARALVLLGEAGSGKSTFVSYLTYLLATGSPAAPPALSGLLPVRLLLREVAAWQAPGRRGTANAGQPLWEALKADIARRLGQDAANRVFSQVQSRLLQQGGLFLLDGLDEVPEANQRRQAIVQAVQALTATLPAAARVLVTARPYAYADPLWRLASFRVLTLAPFTPEQVERFITRWYAAAAPAVNLSQAEADARAGRLRQALQERPYLADLASRPLLLTLMAALHSSWGQLPADRAELYEETVELLLERWQRAKEVTGPDGRPLLEPGIAQMLQAGKDQIRRALQTLAYTVHRRQQSTRGAGAADISEGEVLVAFKPLLGKVDADTLLRYPQERAGLLLARRPGIYAFPHRSFQEFLAACHLADQPDATETLLRLLNDDPAWWREVAILVAGKKKRGGLGDAVAVVSALIPDLPADDPQPAATRWHSALIAGQALLELHFPAQAAGQRHYEAVQRRGQQWLLAFMRSGQLTPAARAEAGRTLARLGDPRPEVLTIEGMEFCAVPAGPFWMGSEDDPDADADEKPLHQVEIPYDFWIGRYPVTNAQFAEFTAAGGYGVARYWPEAQKAGYWAKEGYKGWGDDEPRQKPRDSGEPYTLPNHPVINVDWYEALAFTRWLSERLAGQLPAGWAVRLPGEAEWEKAARGGIQIPRLAQIRTPAAGLATPAPLQPNPQARRRFPWGDDADANQANSAESGVGATSAVGCFPGGASPYGVEELSGNVWEWTRSLWGSDYQKASYRYPYVAGDGRENLAADANEWRVVRGGAYYANRTSVRCALRFWGYPGGWGDGRGFRVVVSP